MAKDQRKNFYSETLNSPPSTLNFLPLIVALALVLTLGAAKPHEELKLADVFSDHMVLQRELPVPIWGVARPGEEITVKFRQQTKKAMADRTGHWMVKLDPLLAGGPDKLFVSDGEKLEFDDVLVGEVWVGSGQSNMALPTSEFTKGDASLAQLVNAAPYPQLRVLLANHKWQEATTTNLNAFSALLFAFGARLQKELNVPVGLMVGAVNGTPSGSWLSWPAFKDDPPCQELLKKAGVAVNTIHTGSLYEQYIRPLIPYGIRGVLWDQGESGTAVTGVDQYTLMGALIRGWRKEWTEGDFPFIYIEKPSGQGDAWDYSNPVTKLGTAFVPLPPTVPNDGTEVELSIRIMNYPQVGMAITSDLGTGLHPVNKYGYGYRAAEVALGMVYGRKIEYYGPLYESHKIEANKIRIAFTHIGQGLAFKNGDRLQGFAVAGADKKFYWADAVIDGNTVVLSSDQVSQPVAVRYAWALWRNWANLFNKDGLPAIPFRTDQW